MAVKACSPHWLFFDFPRDVAMATNYSQKIGLFPGLIYFVALPFRNGLQYHNSDFEILNRMNFSTLCAILVTFGWETPEFTLLTIAPIMAIWQKSACQISQNVLDLSWPIFTGLVGVLVGMITPIFVSQSPKGCCYGNQLNLGDVRRHRKERPLLFASAFDNGLADRKSAFKRLNGNYSATSCTNLVNFHPTISEFTLLKRAVCAAIRAQFYDDLNSSHWRSETDLKIAILIWA